MTNLRTAVWLKYVLVLVGIVSVWLVSTLTPSAASFATLISGGALKSLTIIIAAWAGASATHWLSTGDPNPAPPLLGERKPALEPTAPSVTTTTTVTPAAPAD